MLSTQWTAIATRPRGISARYGQLLWRELTDAPIAVDEAHRLAAAGKLVVASRHLHDTVELVVRPATR